MENEKLSVVSLKGIVRNKPQSAATDGDCEDIINLRYQDGAWRGVGSKTAKSYSIVSDKYFKKIYAPSFLPDGEFVAIGDDIYTYHIVTDGNSESTLNVIATNPRGEHYDRIVVMNNTIILYSSTSTMVIQYVDGGFIPLGQVNSKTIPFPRLAVGETAQYEDEYTLINSVWVDSDGAMTQEQFDAIMADFLPKYAEKVEDGYLSGFMSFVFAWKLYDGNYILHQGCFPIDIYLENTTKIVSDGSPSPDGKRRMEMYVERPSVYYFFPSSARSIIESWYNAGIIKELCVFMSPVRTPDNIFDGELTNWRGYSGYFPPSDFTMVDKIPEEINYYRVGQISIADIIASDETEPTQYIIPLDKGKLTSIETNEALPVDSFSHHDLIPQCEYLYNSRLHLGDITVLPGTIPWPFEDWFDSENYELWECFYPRISTKLSLGHYSGNVALLENSPGLLSSSTYGLQIAVTIIVNGQQYVSIKSIDKSSIKGWWNVSTEYEYISLRGLASYPDIRASKITVLLTSSTDEDSPRVLATLDLTKHPFHNIAYYKSETWYQPTFIRIP